MCHFHPSPPFFLLSSHPPTYTQTHTHPHTGKLALSSFGSILRIALPAGEERVIKAGHLLAWTESTKVLKYGPSSAGM
jgi:hypothetical protein